MYNRNETLAGSEALSFLRNGLRENGVASKLADSLTMAELNEAWTDQTQTALLALVNRPEAKPAPVVPAAGNETAAALMMQALAMVQTKAPALDESRILELIREHAPKPEPSVVQYSFTTAAGTVTTERREHSYFPLIVAALSSLVGAAAGVLGLEHRALSVCAQTTKTDLLGFIDATGVYRGTAFREAFEKGFVFCLDEADNGNPNVLAVLNSALANGEMTFPDATVKRGEGFVCVACANTFGNGATGGYVGRNQIDAATLDRFFFVNLPLDEGLEASFVGVSGVESPAFDMAAGGEVTAAGWLWFVRQARANAETHGVKVVISPRATIGGAKLAAAGVGADWLKKGFLIKALDSLSAGKLFA